MDCISAGVATSEDVEEEDEEEEEVKPEGSVDERDVVWLWLSTDCRRTDDYDEMEDDKACREDLAANVA